MPAVAQYPIRTFWERWAWRMGDKSTTGKTYTNSCDIIIIVHFSRPHRAIVIAHVGGDLPKDLGPFQYSELTFASAQSIAMESCCCTSFRKLRLWGCRNSRSRVGRLPSATANFKQRLQKLVLEDRHVNQQVESNREVNIKRSSPVTTADP